MESARRYSDIGTSHLGVGCLVAPAALVGTAMIAEYPGPPGPLGFAEYFGWLALCIGVGILSARLADRWRNGAPRHHALLLAAFALPLVFTGFLVWEIQPSTPGRVKDIVEYSLQAIGLLTMGLSLGWIGWRSLRR